MGSSEANTARNQRPSSLSVFSTSRFRRWARSSIRRFSQSRLLSYGSRLAVQNSTHGPSSSTPRMTYRPSGSRWRLMQHGVDVESEPEREHHLTVAPLTYWLQDGGLSRERP